MLPPAGFLVVALAATLITVGCTSARQAPTLPLSSLNRLKIADKPDVEPDIEPDVEVKLEDPGAQFTDLIITPQLRRDETKASSISVQSYGEECSNGWLDNEQSIEATWGLYRDEQDK